MFYKLKHFTVTSKEKAAYAFVVSAIGSYMVQSGLTWHQVLTMHGLKALFVGVVTHQFVYLVENSVKV